MPEPSLTQAGAGSLCSVSPLARQVQTFCYSGTSVSQSVKLGTGPVGLGHLLLWGLPRDGDLETEWSQPSSLRCLKLRPILELSFQQSIAVPGEF